MSEEKKLLCTHLSLEGTMKYFDVHFIHEDKILDLYKKRGMVRGYSPLLTQPLELASSSNFRVHLIPVHSLEG